MAEITDPAQKALAAALNNLRPDGELSTAQFSRLIVDALWSLGFTVTKAPCSTWPREAPTPAPEGTLD